MSQLVKKVILNGETIVDLTDTTAEAADVVAGKYFYNALGEKTLGTGDSLVGDSLDLSQLGHVRFKRVSMESSDFYVYKPNSSGLYKYNIDSRFLTTLTTDGTNYSIIFTGGYSNYVIIDSSALYLIDDENNSLESVALDVDNITLSGSPLIAGKTIFVSGSSIVDDNKVYKVVILNAYVDGKSYLPLIDIVDFRSGGLMIQDVSKDRDTYIFDSQRTSALHFYSVYNYEKDVEEFFTEIVSTANYENRVSHDAYSVLGGEGFSILCSHTGMWRIANQTIEKIASGEDFTQLEGIEDNGHYYARFETSDGSAGIQIDMEDGSYSTYTPISIAERLYGVSVWNSDDVALSFTSEGTYTAVDSENRVFANEDLSGTYTVDGQVILTGTNETKYFEYLKPDNILIYFDEGTGEPICYFYPSDVI